MLRISPSKDADNKTEIYFIYLSFNNKTSLDNQFIVIDSYPLRYFLLEYF